MKMITVAAGIGAALCFTTAPAEAKTVCNFPNISTPWDVTMNARMDVPRNGRCSIRVTTSTGDQDARITSQASNGKAYVSGTAIYYEPAKNYLGKDEFTYERTGLDSYGRQAKRWVRVSVYVQD